MPASRNRLTHLATVRSVTPAPPLWLDGSNLAQHATHETILSRALRMNVFAQTPSGSRSQLQSGQ